MVSYGIIITFKACSSVDLIRSFIPFYLKHITDVNARSIGLPNPKLAFVDVTVIGAYER